MAGFIYFIYYLQACTFRCDGQECLEDRADLWEGEVVPGGPGTEKGGSVGFQRLEQNLRAGVPFWLSYSTLLFFSPCSS